MKRALLFAGLLIAFASQTKSQTINTFAGDGSSGNTGNGGPATNATLYNPYGVCMDTAGNLYIADQWNHLVKKVNKTGTITIVAGTGTGSFSGDGGQATAADLYYPAQIYLDKAGDIFIADQFNSRIRKVNTSGVISTVAGTGTASYSGDGGQATAADLNNPTDVTFDAAGNMYIADYSNHRIRMVDLTGKITTVAGNGTASYSGDGAAATAAELNYPYAATVTPDGNLYISDRYNSRIRKVDISGNISTFAGTGTAGYSGDGGAATAAQINNPFKINSDEWGNLFLADFGNSRIRYITAAGVITTIAGTGVGGYSGDGGPATAAKLSAPGGVYPDKKTKSVYIGDNTNERIRVFTFPPLGIDPVTNDKVAAIKVYPNPASSVLTIELGNMPVKSVYIYLFNTLGQQIQVTELKNSTTSLPVSSLNPGIYFYKILDAEGTQLKADKQVIIR